MVFTSALTLGKWSVSSSMLSHDIAILVLSLTEVLDGRARPNTWSRVADHRELDLFRPRNSCGSGHASKFVTLICLRLVALLALRPGHFHKHFQNNNAEP